MVLEQDQRGLLFLTRRGPHREFVAHCQFNPTGSKDLASNPTWRATELRAGPGCA
ncbi:MAG: hypothetical protein ACLP4R_23770 [Solirubrobacteraceae bacterium]